MPHDPKTRRPAIDRKRADEGLTQKQLAARLGVWKSTLVAWEAGLYAPEGKKRARAVAWLGFDVAKGETKGPTAG